MHLTLQSKKHPGPPDHPRPESPLAPQNRDTKIPCLVVASLRRRVIPSFLGLEGEGLTQEVGAMTTLMVATGNAHKIEEIRSGLGNRFDLRSQRDVGFSLQPVEDGTTFAANAAIKSIAWASRLSTEATGKGIQFVLADDSGLEVDALGGAPGVHSARYAAIDDGLPGNSSDVRNNAKLVRLLSQLAPVPWTARVRCVLALTPVTPGASIQELHALTRWFEGTCEGRIQLEAAGQAGFGYDPLFVPEGQTRSFAELGDAFKSQISHRAQALRRLRSFWEGEEPLS